MKKISRSLVLILIALITFSAGVFLQQYFPGITTSLFGNNTGSERDVFAKTVNNFIELFNEGDKKACRYTFPFLAGQIAKKKAQRKMDPEKFKEFFDKDYEKGLVEDISQNLNFFQKINGNRIHYSLISLNEEKLTTQILAKIPHNNGTGGKDSVFSEEIASLKWIKCGEDYYIVKNLISNSEKKGSDYVINNFISDSAEGPLVKLKNQFGAKLVKGVCKK